MTRIQNKAIQRLAASATAISALLLAGCGGSGSNSSVSVRAVDAVPNGGVANINVQGQVANGGLTFFQGSGYMGVAAGIISTSFTFTLLPNITFPIIQTSVASGSSYTALLGGRADITSSSDPRYPKIFYFTDNDTTPPTGECGLRIIHAGPDIGSVDVIVNGQKLASSLTYTQESAGTPGLNGYTDVPTGSATVLVNAAGTSTSVVPLQTISLLTGQNYTMYIVEPTVPPSLSANVQVLDDTH